MKNELIIGVLTVALYNTSALAEFPEGRFAPNKAACNSETGSIFFSDNSQWVEGEEWVCKVQSGKDLEPIRSTTLNAICKSEITGKTKRVLTQVDYLSKKRIRFRSRILLYCGKM